MIAFLALPVCSSSSCSQLPTLSNLPLTRYPSPLLNARSFVLCVSLPMRPGTDSDFWILQGVALLCMLDD